MKNKLIGAALAAALLSSSALAQVNFVPQAGITAGYYAKQTYSSAFFGLVPVSAGTDVVCITGSASKVVRLQRLTIYGTTATAVQSLPIQLLRRATADTGGTAATTTANPGISTQIASRDTGQGLNTSSSAVLISYTANPTINDAAPVYIDSQEMTMPIVTSVMGAIPVDFFFARDTENNVQLPTLRGATQQICVNIGGVTITNASVWNGSVVWTEE